MSLIHDNNEKKSYGATDEVRITMGGEKAYRDSLKPAELSLTWEDINVYSPEEKPGMFSKKKKVSNIRNHIIQNSNYFNSIKTTNILVINL
jgi:hypothetical protein